MLANGQHYVVSDRRFRGLRKHRVLRANVFQGAVRPGLPTRRITYTVVSRHFTYKAAARAARARNIERGNTQ